MRYFLAFLLLASILFSSCSKEVKTYVPQKPAGCDSTVLRYTFADIQPILNTNCAGASCHINSASNNYDFTTYAVVADRIYNGKMAYRLLLSVSDQQHMPQTGPPLYLGTNLDPFQLYKILAWINQGYPEF